MRTAAALLVVAPLFVSGLSGCAPVSRPESQPVAPTAARAPFDSGLAQELVEFHRVRVRRDPQGAIGWAQLAEAYLGLARASDSSELAEKAEEAARKSLELRTRRNARAGLALASALLEQHRFAEALEACDRALRLEPDSLAASRHRAETLLELGHYADAERQLAALPSSDPDPTTAALFARWRELKGDQAGAMRLMASATQKVEENLAASPESVAWFHVRRGDLHVRAGELEAAQAAYMRALELVPRDYRALAAMTRLMALKEDWNGVLEWGRRTQEIVAMTDVEGLIGDALSRLGRHEEAERQFARVDDLNQETLDAYEHARSHGHHHHEVSHTHDRLYAMFLADHGRRLPLALHAAQEDLELRQDAHAYDCVAWVSHKAGRPKAAQRMIAKALERAPHDRQILAHAGLIHASTNPARARAALKKALAKPGALLPLLRAKAQAALRELER